MVSIFYSITTTWWGIIMTTDTVLTIIMPRNECSAKEGLDLWVT